MRSTAAEAARRRFDWERTISITSTWAAATGNSLLPRTRSTHYVSRWITRTGSASSRLAAAAAAATILVWFLIKRPPLHLRVKLALLLGLGVFPALAAASSTVAGMEATTHREFCGSCHVMGSHFRKRHRLHRWAQSLAARHSRNPFFGDRSCYVCCHADYGMYGYAMTKAGGLRHAFTSTTWAVIGK